MKDMFIDLAKYRIQKAFENRTDAILLLKSDKVNDSVNRLYKANYFAVKSLSRTIPTSVEYEDSRQMLAYREDYTLAQSLAFEHYLPRNITKRMNLRPARKSEAADSNQVGDANDSGDGDGK